MKFPFLSRWMTEDTGAVTVDWTVLAAAVVGLGIASAAAVRTGSAALGTDIDSALTSASIVALGTLGAGEAIAEYVHELLAVDQGVYEEWMAILDNYSDEDLADLYTQVALIAQQRMSANDSYEGGLYTDLAAAAAQQITERGGAIPEGSATVEELNSAYHAMG